MKHISSVLLLILLTNFCACATESINHNDVSLTVSAQKHSKVPLLIAVVGNNKQLHEIALSMQKDLAWSGQFDVKIETISPVKTRDDVQKLADRGYPTALFLLQGSYNNYIEWRLYYTRSVAMVAGKAYEKRGNQLCGWAHNIADEVWPALTGSEGFFSTKIAYCKDVIKKPGRMYKHIYIADYDGGNEQLLVATPTINLAPRWNNDKEHPLLFYSESTNANMRLMSIDLKKVRKISSNFDGLNMCPAFSHDGKKVVYCASQGNGACQLYYYGKGEFKKLTNNSGNNISPTLSDDGSKMYFCSDYKQARPQIYCYNMENGLQMPVTESGSCYCPTYSSKKGRLIYAKLASGYTQLFLYDELNNTHQQLTFDASNKDECSFSPCGNYVLYAQEKKGKSHLAMLNLITRESRSIGKSGENYTYPTWSRSYMVYPYLQV